MTRPPFHIALADDDPDDQEMLAERFQRRHSDVRFTFYKDGQHVLGYLQNCPADELPNVLLLDYKMPIATGVEVLKAIYNDHRYDRIHKIVWSTSGNTEYVTACQQYGCKRYFTKPNDLRQLDQIIDYLSAQYRASSNPVSN